VNEEALAHWGLLRPIKFTRLEFYEQKCNDWPVLKINEGSVFISQAINKNAVTAEQITGKWFIFRGTC